MKKVIQWCSFLLLLGAITPAIAQKPQININYKNRVQQLFDYSNNQNWAAMRNAFADTMKMYALSGAVIIDNPDDQITFFKSNHEKFPNEYASVDNLMTIGNKAIIKEKATGHGKDPVYDVMIWEFTGDTISSVWIITEQ